ncbi:MAG: aspartate/glutamate racemase family protein [Pseudomonadota bacterium]
MRILIINPNTTSEMTEAIGNAAQACAKTPEGIRAVNPDSGPASIQGPEDGELALPGLFSVFEREVLGTGGYDAVIIACFDDTGLWQLRQKSPVPVIGIGEAGYQVAMLLGRRFSVVTTLSVSVPVLEDNIKTYGFATRCARVRASGIPVLEADNAQSYGQIENEVGAAFEQDNIQSVVLGCAGMANLADQLTIRYGRPVIDGVAAAVGLCETAWTTTRALERSG